MATQIVPMLDAKVDDSIVGPNLKTKLISKDGVEFVVTRRQAFVAGLLKQALEDDIRADEVKLGGIDSKTLEIIVKYLTTVADGTVLPDVAKPLRSKNMCDVTDEKSATFIDALYKRQELYDLMLGANYMEVKPLVSLTAAKIASLIKGQPLEEIKGLLDPKGNHKAPVIVTKAVVPAAAPAAVPDVQQKVADKDSKDSKDVEMHPSSSSSSSSSAISVNINKQTGEQKVSLINSAPIPKVQSMDDD